VSAQIVCVKGTWHGEWCDPGSPFRSSVLECVPPGFTVYEIVDYWTGDVDGLPKWLSWFKRAKYSDWSTGGTFLAWVLLSMPYERRNILSHSHGIQVVAFAAEILKAKGQRIRRVVDVCGPVRSDLAPQYAALRETADYWLHIASKGGDKMQLFGEFGDGALGWVRENRAAHRNVVIPGIGHSGLLYEAKLFPEWSTEKLLDVFLTETADLLPKAVTA
jgi:hypothetical protein